jgi:hypothetical protein
VAEGNATAMTQAPRKASSPDPQWRLAGAFGIVVLDILLWRLIRRA